MAADESPAEGSGRRGLSALISDFISLVELQGKLLVHDLHQMRSGSGPALLMLVMGAVLAFATVPVLLLGLGLLVASMWDWPVWAATITVAFAGGVGPAMILMLLGWNRMQNKLSILSRSATELRRNSQWLKHRLKSVG